MRARNENGFISGCILVPTLTLHINQKSLDEMAFYCCVISQVLPRFRCITGGKASGWRLGGRAGGILVRVGGANATEKGRPGRDHRPDWEAEIVDFRHEEEEEVLWVKLAQCCAGSLALIA